VSVAALLRLQVRLHRAPLALLALGLGLFEGLMTVVARQPAISGFLGDILHAAPPQLLAVFGENLMGAVSVKGIVGIGYTHPFALVVMAVWAVRVSSAALAGEIGRGTMDLVAARPVRRAAHVLSAALAVLGGLALLAGLAWLATAAGLAGRALPGAAIMDFVPVALALWALFGCFGMVGVLISALAREAGTAIAWTSSVLAGSYALDYAARVWPAMAWLRPLSLFRYYEPQRILSAGLAPADLAVLGAVGAVALLLALAAFARRDL
jgi:beta-exotoxin I transport system permease protein